MPKMIFVSLPVTNLEASMTFYKSLGFQNNAHFTDDTTACMVCAMNKAAATNGGTLDVNPVQDLGFMYNRSLTDPDGHIWEAVWMNPAAVPSDDQTH